VLAWLAYATYLAVGGRFRRVLWLSAEQRSLRALARDAWAHLRLRRARGDAALAYNPLQKVAYLIVLLVLIPLAVATGLTMSNAVTARIPELYSVFGGRQSARTLHALCALLLTLFALVHILQAVVAGFWNELRSMLTGYFRIRGRESS
jgi:thiosulfate reductase cytochrome b subunit